jgi:hypothetical protein
VKRQLEWWPEIKRRKFEKVSIWQLFFQHSSCRTSSHIGQKQLDYRHRVTASAIAAERHGLENAARSAPISAIEISSTRFAVPSWRRISSKTSGALDVLGSTPRSMLFALRPGGKFLFWDPTDFRKRIDNGRDHFWPGGIAPVA